MKEQELLHAIQNADQRYYEEAEQLVFKRRVRSMKPSIIQHIMAGTAVAAALAVTAVCGWQVYSANKELTASEQTYTPAITAARPETTAAAAPVVQISDESKVNFLGGHGAVHYSRKADLMFDRDNWYFGTGSYAEKTDAEELTVHSTTPFEELSEREGYLHDRLSGALYSYSMDTGVIWAYDDDGNKTPLNTSEYQLTQDPNYLPDQITYIERIAKLSDTCYYIDGYRWKRADDGKMNPPITEFWTFFDTETQEQHGSEGTDTGFIGYDYLYPDGEGGIYTMMLAKDAEDGHWALAHLNEDGAEIILDEGLRSWSWYMYDNCIYYMVFESNDFYKYDLETKEKTTLLENCGFGIVMLSGDTVYAEVETETAGEIHMMSCNPDLSNRKDWTISHPESRAFEHGLGYLRDAFDGYLYFVVPACIGDTESDADGNETAQCLDAYAIIYDLETGTAQKFFYETPPGYTAE